MFKRFENKQLMIALGAMALLYLLGATLGGRRASTFKEVLASVDTATISKVRISQPGQDPVELIRNGSAWRVNLSGGQNGPTAANMAVNAIAKLTLVEASQLVSRSEAEWGNYDLTEEKATRIEVLDNEETKLDLFIGKFLVQAGTFVRLPGEDEVYAVEGNLNSSFAKPRDDWRDKSLFTGTSNDWTAMAFTHPGDSSFQLLKGANNSWTFADTAEAIEASAVNSYVSGLGYTKGATFAEIAPPSNAAPIYQLAIQSLSSGQIELRVFPDPTHQFIITSTANPGAFFADPDESLVKKIFAKKTQFIPASPDS